MHSSAWQPELGRNEVKGMQPTTTRTVDGRLSHASSGAATQFGLLSLAGKALCFKETLPKSATDISRVLVVLIWLCTIVPSHGQGLVNFMNTPTTLISAGVPGGTAAISTPAGTYYFALLIAEPGTTDPRLFTFSGVYATNSSFAGRIFGGNGLAVPEWMPGTAKSFMVFGWPASAGTAFNFGWLSGQPWLREFGMSSIGMGTAGGTDSNGQALPPLWLFGGTGGVGFDSPISVGFNIGLECLSCNPPQIMTQPQDQWVTEGMRVQFIVGVQLTPQLSYQWYCNGVAIYGATNSVLELGNVSLSQNTNRYYALAGNPWGTVTSSTVTLYVSPAVRLVPGLSIAGQPGMTLEIDRSDAMGSSAPWSKWQSVVLASAPECYFDTSGSAPQRYYRTVQNPGPGPGPILELHLVPTITLSGTVSSQIEIDYLKPSGSTNAWVEATTVTLTNNPQFYFDTSAIGQPPRFYRLLTK